MITQSGEAPVLTGNGHLLGEADSAETMTLPFAWQRNWSRNPEAPAIISSGQALRADELEERSRRIAGRLRAAGLEPGDRLLMNAGTSIDLAIVHIAAVRLGLVVIPANPSYTEREIEHLVRDCRPSAVLVDSQEKQNWIEHASVDSPMTFGPTVELPDGDAGNLDAAGSADLAMIVYTSGTTGVPKGAMLSHGNLLAGVQSVVTAWDWNADDRLILALPIFHMHGLGVGLHGTLLAGASAVLLDRFDVDAVIDAASDEKATLFFGVPTMYGRLVDSPRIADFRRLRLCVSGSSALPSHLHRSFAARSKQTILERYGMTETLMNASNPYDGERRPGTVGFPLPGVEIELSNGSSGEIAIRGPNVFMGYWDRPDDTAKSLRSDGFLDTGDLGEFDADGYLRIVGRTKDLIISGGFNVYPREVEDVLLQDESVADVAVIGTPSDEWGEIVTAVIVANGPARPDRIDARAIEHLAPFKRPRLIRFVDEIPRNAMGKVIRDELK